MSNKYVCADLHLFHTRIINYCDRPFKDLVEMHNTIISNWNSVVTSNDITYVLGDITFGGLDETAAIINQLHGTKVLIKGNHDRHSNTWFINAGFSEVYKHSLIIDNYLLTHKPTATESKVNVHGHLHHVISNLDTTKYRCVSLERINYSPVLL